MSRSQIWPRTLPFPVYITGTGVVSCAGHSPQSLWQNAFSGKTGVSEGLGRVLTSELNPEFTAKISRTTQGETDDVKNSALLFCVHAAGQALQEAGWAGLNSDDGLIMATTTGQIPLWDQALLQYLRREISRQRFEQAFAHQPIGCLLDGLCDAYDFSGRSFLVSSACTSSTQALALGAAWIQQKRVKRCLVVGVEVLCTLTIEGFKSLQLLSPDPARPFDIGRRGINLSEGAAALCLEQLTGADTGDFDRALARISGYGLTTDSYHMTAPQPEGRGCLDAMTKAVASADLSTSDISWVHAHGTGSPHNDSSEGSALEKLFGTTIEAMPFVSSTKNIHGHGLGASGALEVVLCVEAIRQQVILKTPGLEQPDPAIHVRHPLQNLRMSVKHLLKNTLGFGGTNASLILSDPREPQPAQRRPQ